MRVLLDECLPARFARDLTGHEVKTVPQAGWAGIKNGRLLKLVTESGRFEAFVTVDKSLRHQQNLRDIPFGIAVLRARSNNLADVRPFAPELLRRLPKLRPGEVIVLLPPRAAGEPA